MIGTKASWEGCAIAVVLRADGCAIHLHLLSGAGVPHPLHDVQGAACGASIPRIQGVQVLAYRFIGASPPADQIRKPELVYTLTGRG